MTADDRNTNSSSGDGEKPVEPEESRLEAGPSIGSKFFANTFGKAKLVLGKTTALMDTGIKWWQSLLMFLDLTTDRVKSRVINALIFLLVFSSVAALFFPFLVQDPALKYGTDDVYKIDVLTTFPELIRFQEDVPELLFRLTNEKNIGVKDVKVRITVTDFVARQETMPPPLKQSGLRCKSPDRENNLSGLRADIFFCQSAELESCSAVTDKYGFAKITGCRIIKGYPGNFEFSLARDFDRPNGELDPFTCNFCDTAKLTIVQGTVRSVEIGKDIDVEAFENIEVMKPLPPFTIRTLDIQGRPLANRQCTIGSWPLEGYGSDLLFWLPDRTFERQALWENNVGVTDVNGTITFTNLTCIATNNPYTFIFAVCENGDTFLPYTEAGILEYKGLMPLKTSVGSVDIVTHPNLAFNTTSVQEGTPFPVQPEVRVTDAQGNPLVGRTVWAQVAAVGDAVIPRYYDPNAPGRFQFRTISDSRKRAINLVSLPTDANGIARWEKLGVARAGKTGKVRFKFICDGIESTAWSNPVAISTSVRNVILAGNPPERYVLGQRAPGVLTMIVRDEGGNPVYGKMVEFKWQRITTDLRTHYTYPPPDSDELILDQVQVASDADGFINVPFAMFRGGISGQYTLQLQVDEFRAEMTSPITIEPRPLSLSSLSLTEKCDIRMETLTPLPSEATSYRPLGTVPRYRFTSVLTGAPITGEVVCIQAVGPSIPFVGQTSATRNIRTDSNGVATFPNLHFIGDSVSADFKVAIGQCPDSPADLYSEIRNYCTEETAIFNPERCAALPQLRSQCFPQQEVQTVHISMPVHDAELVNGRTTIDVSPGDSLSAIQLRIKDKTGAPVAGIPVGLVLLQTPTYHNFVAFQWFLSLDTQYWINGLPQDSNSAGVISYGSFTMSLETPPGTYTIILAAALKVFPIFIHIRVRDRVAKMELLQPFAPAPGQSYIECGEPIPQTAKVRFTDANGNPVPGARGNVGIGLASCPQSVLPLYVGAVPNCVKGGAIMPASQEYPIAQGGVVRDSGMSTPADANGIADFRYYGIYGSTENIVSLTFAYPNGEDMNKWQPIPSTVVIGSHSTCYTSVSIEQEPPEIVSYGSWDVPRVPPPQVEVLTGTLANSKARTTAVIMILLDQSGRPVPLKQLITLRYDRLAALGQGEDPVNATGPGLPSGLGFFQQWDGGLVSLEQTALADLSRLPSNDIGRARSFRIAFWSPGARFLTWSKEVHVSNEVGRVELLSWPRVTTPYAVGDVLIFQVRVSLKSNVGIPRQVVNVRISSSPNSWAELTRSSRTSTTDNDGVAKFIVTLNAGVGGEYQFQFSCGGKKSPPTPPLQVVSLVSTVAVLQEPEPLDDTAIVVVKPGEAYPSGYVPANAGPRASGWTNMVQPVVHLSRFYARSNISVPVRSETVRPVLLNPGNAILRWNESVLSDDDGVYRFRDLHFQQGSSGTYMMAFVSRGVQSRAIEINVRDPLEPDLDKLKRWQLAVLTQGLPLIVLWLGTSEWTSDFFLLPGLGYLGWWVFDKVMLLRSSSDVRIVDAFDVVLKLQTVICGLMTLSCFFYLLWVWYKGKDSNSYGSARQIAYRDLVSRLLLTPSLLRQRNDADPELKAIQDKLDEQQDEYEDYMKAQLVDLLRGVDRQDHEAGKKLTLKQKVLHKIKGAPQPADYHSAFFHTKKDFFYSQRWLFAFTLSAFVIFLCFLVAIWIVTSAGFYVNKIEQEVVALEVKTKVNPSVELGLRIATADDVNQTVQAISAELGYETVLPANRINTTELIERIENLKTLAPDLQTMLITYVRSQKGVQRSLSHVQKVTDELQRLADAGVQLGAEYGIDSSSLERLDSGGKAVRNWLKSLRDAETPLSVGFMRPIYNTLVGTGITASILAVFSVFFIWFLMFRQYRVNIMQMRMGTFPFEKDNFTPLPAANYIGIQTSHTAFEFFFIFFLLWAILALVSMEAVRVYVWNMIGPTIRGLFTYTLIAKVVTNLIFSFYACRGRNIHDRPVFEILLVVQTFLSVLSGIMTAIARVVVLVVGFVFFYMRLDTPLLTSPHEHRDPGFLAYASALFMDFEYNNPIFQVAVELLLGVPKRGDKSTGTGDGKEGPEDGLIEEGAIPLQNMEATDGNGQTASTNDSHKQTKAQRYRNLWQLAYTLQRNESLRQYRGHAIHQAAAVKLGASLHELVEHEPGKQTSRIALGRSTIVSGDRRATETERELVRRATVGNRSEAGLEGSDSDSKSKHDEDNVV